MRNGKPEKLTAEQIKKIKLDKLKTKDQQVIVNK